MALRKDDMGNTPKKSLMNFFTGVDVNVNNPSPAPEPEKKAAAKKPAAKKENK